MQQWQLLQEMNLLGTLKLERMDQPWWFCRFESTPAFEQYRHLFEVELNLINADKLEEWQQAYQAIDNLHLELRAVDREEIIEDFLLHIEKDKHGFDIEAMRWNAIWTEL